MNVGTKSLVAEEEASKSFRSHALNAVLFSIVTLIPFFTYNSYPIFTFTFLAAVLVFSVIFCALAFAFYRLRISWLFYALLIVLYAEFHFDTLHRVFIKLKGVTHAWVLAYTGILVYLLLVIAFAYLAKKQIKKIAQICLVVLLISSFASAGFGSRQLPSEQRPVVQDNHSNIIILILDEHAGLLSLDGLTPELTTLRKRAGDWLTSKGFCVYSSAYSNFSESVNSIPDIINGSAHSGDPVTGGPETYKVVHNAILKKLSHMGYSIRVYQSTYLDFCSSADFHPAACLSYPHNPISFMENTNLRLTDKLVVILETWTKAQRSRYLRRFFAAMMARAKITDRGFTYSLAGIPMLRQLQEDFQKYPTGTVFFVHLPLPHFPYLFRSDCSVNPIHLWETRGEAHQDSMLLQKKYHLYSDQLNCLHTNLQNLVTTLQTAPSYKSTNIIIFGDHGSRITAWDPDEKNLNRTTHEDVINTFNAFLAIKNGGFSEMLPANSGEYKNDPVALTSIVSNFFGIPYDSASEKIIHLRAIRKNKFLDVDVPDFHDWKLEPNSTALFTKNSPAVAH